MERNEIKHLLESLGFTMSVEFVPYSKVSNERKESWDPNNPTFNYRVTISREHWFTHTLTVNYTMGCIFSPSYNNPIVQWQGSAGPVPYHYRKAILDAECELGKVCQYWEYRNTTSIIAPNHAILPTIEDVLHSLLLEYDVINHPTFESWADDFGYDTDSRKAEKTYRDCLKTALAFRPMIADCEETLRDAFQDF